MPRSLLVVLGAAVLIVSPAIAVAQPMDRYERVSLVLPVGDAQAGRATFIELRCTTCHPVAGDRVLPKPSSANPGPELSAALASPDVGRLASSIVAPSHIISASIPPDVKERLKGFLSPMADFSSVMTLRQLADLVAYLRQEVPTMVTLSMDLQVSGNELLIQGSTDLPDGTLIAYEVRNDQLPIDYETPEWMLFREGAVPVEQGSFAARVDASGLDAGRFEVVAAFRPTLPKDMAQPAAIIDRFGSAFERLLGPNVVAMDGDAHTIQVTRTVRR